MFQGTKQLGLHKRLLLTLTPPFIPLRSSSTAQAVIDDQKDVTMTGARTPP